MTETINIDSVNKERKFFRIAKIFYGTCSRDAVIGKLSLFRLVFETVHPIAAAINSNRNH